MMNDYDKSIIENTTYDLRLISNKMFDDIYNTIHKSFKGENSELILAKHNEIADNIRCITRMIEEL